MARSGRERGDMPEAIRPAQMAGEERAEEITIALIEDLFSRPGSRRFDVRLWNGRILKARQGDSADLTLTLTHPGALRAMLLPPGELTLGEAYLGGDFDVEGDMVSLLAQVEHLQNLSLGQWLSILRRAWTLPRSEPPQQYQEGRRPMHLSGQEHSRERDRQAVTYHYDTGNDFYALFLGRWMAYSCAYFETPETDLDTAQAAKFEHICRKLRLKPGERLLDIGCGWGGLVVYAAEHFGVEATGINLSQPQIDYGRDWIRKAGLEDQARIELLDYRDIDPGQPYDKIVSVGMVEHVGRERLDEYFQAAYRALRPGGLFLNHAIGTQRSRQDTWLERTFLQRGKFSQSYVFPDGELVWISEMLQAAERCRFEVRDVESLREHYALTLRRWIANLERQHEAAVAIKDERTYRTWRLYMSAAAYGFDCGNTNVYQTLLSKTEAGQAELPLTRDDVYRPSR
jgi:cyclopropane-fatty-acyl-phospholipid synthase